MKTIGYNAVDDRGDPAFVKANAPFKCTRRDAWLGHGYYFWDSDDQRGHEWGDKGYNGKYMLGKSNLNLPNLLDLTGDVDDMKYMEWLLEEFKANFIKFNDSSNFKDIPLGKAIEYMKIVNTEEDHKGIFDFDSIRGHDYPRDSTPIRFVEHKDIFLHLNPRVQICVINKDCVKSYELIYPERYL